MFFKICAVGKRLAELCYPTEAGFKRRSCIINIITIQTIAHFQTQCISCPKANWLYAAFFAGFKNGVPYFFCIIIFILKIYFHTTCTCITRCAYQHIFNTRKYAFCECVIFKIHDIHFGKRLQNLCCIGALYGKQTGFIRYVMHLHSLIVKLLNPVPVFFNIACIYYKHISFVFFQAIHDQVINNTAIIIWQATILCFTGR